MWVQSWAWEEVKQTAAAMALGQVYCLGPTFRAEKSKTRRHLTEFWMLEPEVARRPAGVQVGVGEARRRRTKALLLRRPHCNNRLDQQQRRGCRQRYTSFVNRSIVTATTTMAV